MKKILFALLLLSISLTGCAKTKSSSTTVQTQEPAPVVQESVQISPELEKLNRVLMSMTDRCKAAIPNGDPNEFLADLKKVLEIEKAFPSDDLSLYYLIDKTHKVGADYEPTHLRKLVQSKRGRRFAAQCHPA